MNDKIPLPKRKDKTGGTMRTILLLIFMSMMGQSSQASMGSYTVATSYGIVNHIPDCVAGKHNCWHNGNTMLTGVASGVVVFGINGSNQVLKYSDYPTNSWAVQSGLGTSMTQLAVAGATLYALGNSSQCTGSNGGSKMYESVSPYTSWTQIGNCDWGAISGSVDGTLVAVANYGSTSGCAYTYSGTAYTFTQIGSSCTWSKMTPMSNNMTFGLSTSGGLYICLPTLGTCATYAGPSGVTLSALTTDGFTHLYALSAGTAYHIDVSQSSPTWDTLNGPSSLTAISASGTNNTWAVGATNGNTNIYRFPNQSRQVTRTLTAPPVPMCVYHGCPTITHTVTLQAGWKGSYTGTNGNVVYNPGVYLQNSNLALNTASSATMDDPFFCLEDDSSCTPTSTGSVVCSQAGEDWTDPGLSGLPTYSTLYSIEAYLGNYQYSGSTVCSTGLGCWQLIACGTTWDDSKCTAQPTCISGLAFARGVGVDAAHAQSDAVHQCVIQSPWQFKWWQDQTTLQCWQMGQASGALYGAVCD